MPVDTTIRIDGVIVSVASAALAVLLAVEFLILGTAKILALGSMRAPAAEVGLSTGAYRRIGALGLLTGPAEPLIGELAGTGWFLLITGALITHLRLGHEPWRFAPAVVAGLLAAAFLSAAIGGLR
jgi:hypothetical protein